MTDDTDVFTAILSIKDDVGDIKKNMGETKANVITLLKHKSDQEKRIRDLEKNSSTKKGAVALLVFLAVSGAGWLGLHFGDK